MSSKFHQLHVRRKRSLLAATHHGERVAEQDQELGQDLLPHGSLELDQAADAATGPDDSISDC